MQKSILITGCSSGIGLDAARSLSQRGWQVFASARSAEACAMLRDEGLVGLHIDYEDPTTFGPALDTLLGQTGGRLDALFHNGAYAIAGPLEDIPGDAMRAIFQANLIGWHELTNLVIPVMRAQGHGRIVMNSSVLGLVGMKWRGAYVATKFALEGMSDVLRMEMADTGIKVILIEPGPIETDFRKNAILQFEKWIDWERSARVEQYRASLLDQLYKGSSKGPQWPASAVTDALIHAVENNRPRARYHVTTPTKVMAVMRRLLPTRMLDWLLSRG
ncbi:SDR family NAD(P)-dependent oxidoreductase [Puniceibacterium sediminis]|uniref:Short-chain dehydrogenase n=1 Tax=Puniceibacterium sediminis TaxID=1608407 RepID=A0A238WHY8_9RHOB|nr:SDR family NAD(P)-dependent oxidoreductase [Puniceibacterium sediminis]SNR46160.1 Short-chain dehydrogenase [Puniceibacterium sediminis]